MSSNISFFECKSGRRSVRLASHIGLLLGLCAANAHAGINSWSTRTLDYNAVTSVRPCAANPSVLYAESEQYIHKSTDDGVTWQTIFKIYPLYWMEVEVDPTDCDRVFVVSQDGLVRSDDGGRTFTLIDARGATVRSAGAVAYYMSDDDVMRSTDHGVTWQRVSTVSIYGGHLRGMAVHPSAPDTVSMIEHFGARHSTDGGVTWVSAPGVPLLSMNLGVSVGRLFYLSPSHIVASASGSSAGSIIESTDSGASWHVVPNSTRGLSAIEPGTGALVSRTAEQGQLMRSTDLGVTWTNIGNPAGVRVHGMAVSGAGTFMQFTTEGVLRSIDDGATWVNPGLGPVGTEAVQLEASVARGRVYALPYWGWVTNTAGDHGWDKSANTYVAPMYDSSALAVQPGASGLLYQIIQNSRGSSVNQSTDGGTTWTTQPTAGLEPSVRALAVDPQDGANLFALISSPTAPAGLYRSTDSGANWSARSVNLPTELQFARRLVIGAANASRMFIPVIQSDSPYGALTAGPQGLYRSDDAGVQWTRTLADLNVHDVAIHPVNTNVVYAMTSAGMQVSTDGGVSFNVNPAFSAITDQQASAIAIDPLVPSTLYASSLDYNIPSGSEQRSSYVLRSVDSGQSWEVLRSESDRPNWRVRKIVADPAAGGLVYISTDHHGVATFQIVSDLSLQLVSQPGSVPAGTPAQFEFRLENTGEFATTATRLSAKLPANMTGASGTIAGGDCTVEAGTVECVVPVLQPDQQVNANITFTPAVTMVAPIAATASARESDIVRTNNGVQVGEVVDLTTATSISAATVNVGAAVTYTIEVANEGAVNAASAATATFSFNGGVNIAAAPGGCTRANNEFTCEVGGLAAGASRTYTVSGTANAAGASTVTVNVTASSSAIDTNVDNNASSASLTIQAAPSEPPPSSPSTPPSRGGGGGAFGLELLFALSLLGAARIRRKLSL